MATHVKNSGRVPKHVWLIMADGAKASIRVMARTRKPVTLPDGAKVDPNWMALEGQGIIVFEDKVVPVTTEPNTGQQATATVEAEAATTTEAAPQPAPAETKTENTQ
jgi:hypothetical protein